MPPTVFIVGASRGIGKGLVDVFHKAGWSVHATIRNTNVTFPSNVVTHLMDVENEDQIQSVANSAKLYNVPSIDLFIHNAVADGTRSCGILHLAENLSFSLKFSSKRIAPTSIMVAQSN